MNIIVLRAKGEGEVEEGVLEVPVLKPVPEPGFRDRVRGLCAQAWDAAVFMSTVAVELVAQAIDRPCWGLAVAVGPSTCRAVEEHFETRCVKPTKYYSGGVVELVRGIGRVVVFRSSEASRPLNMPNAIEVGLYRLEPLWDRVREVEEVIRAWEGGNAEYAVIVSSPRVAEVSHRALSMVRRGIVVAIGPTTAERLRSLGIACEIPENYTIAHAVDYARRRLNSLKQ